MRNRWTHGLHRTRMRNWHYRQNKLASADTHICFVFALLLLSFQEIMGLK